MVKVDRGTIKNEKEDICEEYRNFWFQSLSEVRNHQSHYVKD
jgi:hypothetical protein